MHLSTAFKTNYSTLFEKKKKTNLVEKPLSKRFSSSQFKIQTLKERKDNLKKYRLKYKNNSTTATNIVMVLYII